jgi:Zn-dependent protease/CBS domain-containing protein
VSAGLRIGRLGGVDVQLHWSWLIVVVLVVWSLAGYVFPDWAPGESDAVYLAMGVIATLLFFVSLLLHELGHARVAIREGVEIDGITLWIFGGIARLRGPFPSAGTELRVAVAGPLVSLGIGLAGIGLSLLPLPDAIDTVALWLGEVNLILLAFNLIPAYPLDGGRILHAYLWGRSADYLRATRTASVTGRTFGQFFIAAGIVLAIGLGAVGGLWIALIGWFVMAAADAERMAAEGHEALRGVRVSDVMITDPICVPPHMDLQTFMDEVFYPHRFTAYPVSEAGAPLGIVSFRSVLERPTPEWPRLRVADAMTPVGEVSSTSPETPLESALETLASTPLNRILVIGEGRLRGLLSITDATRFAAGRRAQLVTGEPDGQAPRRSVVTT